MRVTQGTFSFLPDLTEAQILRQLEYALSRGWALSVEYTERPAPPERLLGAVGDAAVRPARPGRGARDHPRLPREAHPQSYVKVNAFDSTQGWETVRLSFIVQRPADEAGFHLVREEGPGRIVRYSVRSRGEAVPRPQATRRVT